MLTSLYLDNFSEDLHVLISELSNINELCQLLQLADNREDIGKYCGMLLELSDDTIRWCAQYRVNEMLE